MARAGSVDARDDSAGFHPVAVVHPSLETGLVAHLQEGRARERQTSDNARLTCRDHGAGGCGGGNRRLRRDVARAAEVFGQRRAHGVFDEERGEFEAHSLVRAFKWNDSLAVPIPPPCGEGGARSATGGVSPL